MKFYICKLVGGWMLINYCCAGVPRAGGAARDHPARGRRQPRERLAAGDVRPRQQGQGGQQQGSAQQGHGDVVESTQDPLHGISTESE